MGYKEASSFATTASPGGYDYIIVGGGTAGCPLAATLSKKYSVLLLERGGSPYGNINISRFENFKISLTDTSPGSPSQAFISTDGVINARARVLGGGTCLNAGFYSRASPRYVRRAGWDSELVNESYPWVERQIVHWPVLAPWQKALRDGLLAAGVTPINGYTYDHVYGTKVGGTTFDRDGFRHTAADLLSSGDPDNLHVLIHASVQRILFDTTKGTTSSLIKWVRRRHPLRGSNREPTAPPPERHWPARDLEKIGLPIVLDNAFVGKGMADNPMNSVFIPIKRPINKSLIQTVGITKMGAFIEASSGFSHSCESINCQHGIMSAETYSRMLTHVPAHCNGTQIGQLSTVPPKQRTLEMARAYAESKATLPKECCRGGSILAKIKGPLSTGELRLLNLDADEGPSVTFNYFNNPLDLQRCVYGVRTIEKIVRSGSFAGLIDDGAYSMEALLNMSVRANVNLIPKHTNDTKSVEQFCKDTVVTIWHYHGGCQVGKVVGKDYRVVGVDGLRVVDGSTFIGSPGTNPQATTYSRILTHVLAHCNGTQIGQLSTVPPKQRTLEMARAYAESKATLPKEAFQGGSILEKIKGPLSTGELRLLNLDADEGPSVTFNYFNNPLDLQRCVYGVRTIEKIVRSGSFAGLIDDVEKFCKDTVVTIWHYHGGCQVGKVVGKDYRVVGVDGLRVVDGSTFIGSPGTNPQATVCRSEDFERD
ncbi:Protein HOTHEAD [Acorus calamus]|uniref:Protein HOTHEAD n=1 Tax=Acorus calamus TaxID=4465 RepID=A0AAV9C0I6_ACOCL|nr:Protein HOTHEAD [Acorus calamus]